MFPDLMIVSSKRTFLQIIYKTPVAEAALKQARQERFEGRVAEAVGLRRVLECLVANQSVLVGHNAFQDFVFVWSQFMGALPDTLEEFCEVVSENFPQYSPLFLSFFCLLGRCSLD
jgi:CAF1 family ribonuclease